MAVTTLAAQVLPSDVTAVVLDASQLAASSYQGAAVLGGQAGAGYALIGGEFVHYNSVVGNVLSLDQRGIANSDQTAHPVGEIVQTVNLASQPLNSQNSQVDNVYVHARKRGEQWDVCVRCGFSKPMSRLTQQKGILLCTDYCWDDLTVERRAKEILNVLVTTAAPFPEGSDRRVVDRGFFIIDVETG